MFVRFELFPLLAKFELDVSLYNKAGLVLVDTIGSMPVQNTMLAIGFHIATLDVSWSVVDIVAVAFDLSLSVLVGLFVRVERIVLIASSRNSIARHAAQKLVKTSVE